MPCVTRRSPTRRDDWYPADGIAFLLVVPLLIVIYRGTIVVAFVPILLVVLFVWLPIVLLLQLSFQLMVSLSESFNYYG